MRPLLIFSLFLSSSALADPVILLTVDGVRTDEVFSSLGQQLLPNTHAWVKDEGFAFGNRARPMRISNRAAKSLPGYRAIMSGEIESRCRDNDCPQIDRPTLFDGRPGVVFASWDRIARAVRMQAGSMEGSIAFFGVKADHVPESVGEELHQLSEQARQDLPPWSGSRWDRYTWEMGLKYLASTEPEVTWLSFVDTDEWAHAHQKRKYREAIREFDDRFAELRELLARQPGRLERTSFVITTDHGRGRWFFWGGHGKELAHSKTVWSFVVPSATIREKYKVRATPLKTYTQSQIRSTVELLHAPAADRSEKYRAVPLVQLSGK